jgi:hypothetical protein
MVRKERNLKTPETAAVEMAVAAVENNRRVTDMPVAGVDPAPGALDLPEVEQPCSRCGRPAVGRCPECGCPLCGDCLGTPDMEDSC